MKNKKEEENYMVSLKRLGGTVVTRSPLTTMAWIPLQKLFAACGMFFTFYSQCLVVFPLATNYSDWNRLVRQAGLVWPELVKSIFFYLKGCDRSHVLSGCRLSLGTCLFGRR